jgi:tetratricopeptide (TPR) repeat protein
VGLQLLQLDETRAPASVRERELEVGALVLRAVRERDGFVVRRAVAAVAELEPGPVRRALRRAAEGLSEGENTALLSGLLSYGAVLERHGVYDEAASVYSAVMAARPTDACATLHAARAARKAGRRDDALALYRRAADQAVGDPRLLLVVRVGAALVSEAPEAVLTAVLRDARRGGHGEAVAIAREERARLRVSARRTGAALRDLAAAAARYPDRIDRVRVLQRMAELLSARGDLLAARESLLAALEQADTAQRAHTVQRLRTIARAMGDELELRRSRGQGAAAITTLTPVPSRRVAAAESLAPRIRRWRSLFAPPSVVQLQRN